MSNTTTNSKSRRPLYEEKLVQDSKVSLQSAPITIIIIIIIIQLQLN